MGTETMTIDFRKTLVFTADIFSIYTPAIVIFSVDGKRLMIPNTRLQPFSSMIEFQLQNHPRDEEQ